jgi:hypothetical protein
MARQTHSRVVGLALALASVAHAADEPKPIALFDGKSLSGWTFYLVDPKVKMDEVWSVRDHMIVCKGEPLGYLMTKEKFTNFRLVVEWRWALGATTPPAKTPNSGVLLRINGEARAIPRSYEAQLRSGDAGDLYGFWGMRLEGDPARARGRKGDTALGDMSGVAKAEGSENPVGQWNRYEITLDETKLTVVVNDRKVNEATAMDVVPGSVGLQSEGGEIHFRKVELTPLP